MKIPLTCRSMQNRMVHSHLGEHARTRHERELLPRALEDWFLTKHSRARKHLDYVFHTMKAVPQEGHYSG